MAKKTDTLKEKLKKLESEAVNIKSDNVQLNITMPRVLAEHLKAMGKKHKSASAYAVELMQEALDARLKQRA